MNPLGDRILPTINDLFLGPAVEPFRRRLIGATRGRVLEIGAGSGLNFQYYQSGTEVVAIEPATAMRKRAGIRARAHDVRASISLAYGNVNELAFDAGSFDAVVFTFVLCSVPDLDFALREARRVLRPGGSLHLAEHVLSSDARIAKWQRRVQPVWGVALSGCQLVRDIRGAVERVGFDTSALAPIELPLPRITREGILGAVTRP